MNRLLILRDFEPSWLGGILECHEALGSTNDRAREILDELGASGHGAVVVASSQTRGRGRLGRTWLTTPGHSLALSVALWPRQAEPSPCVALAGSLAVATALCELEGLSPRLKWPNDVLLGGRKVAGVLLEGRYAGETAEGLALGIGVNLNQEREDFPPELRDSAVSVRQAAGRAVSPEAFAAALLRSLSKLLVLGLEDPAALVDAAAPWWDHGPQDELEVLAGDGTVRGRFVGIGKDGELRLQCGAGVIALRFGEVARVRRAGPSARADGGEP
jgi:BirA family biotin operon repressor/biotin-[acetyl-CoA-carboxylase] ligase